MYKKILVPLDGSGIGECVFEHVRGVATGCHVPEVDLLYVVPPMPTPWAGEGETVSAPGKEFMRLHSEGEKRSEAWGKEYLAKVSSDLEKDGIAVKSVILKGIPAEEILDYAKKNDVDLIIMSTHGRSGPARWAFGSVAERVIRLSAAPVIVVRPAACSV